MCVYFLQLKLPVPILLRTVELFEHFSEKYIHQLIKTRNSSSRTFLPPTSYMTDFRKEVAHKTLLHLMSCLQITSKLDDTYLVCFPFYHSLQIPYCYLIFILFFFYPESNNRSS